MPPPTATSARLLPVTLRGDVQWRQQVYRGAALALALDPLTGRQWLLRPEEAFLCYELRARKSLSELRQAWERRFAPRRLSPAALQQGLGRLTREGLLVATGAAQAGELLALREERKAERRKQWWAELWAIRGPSCDPSRWLPALRPIGAVLCSRAALLLLGLAGCVTIAFALSLIPQLTAGAARLATLTAARNWVTWIGVLAAVKALHELGHAVIAATLGVRCRRLGILILTGVPTLYCQVNDAWRADKRSRLLINAAGMLVETWLACGGFWLWWSTAPGVWHDLALQTAILCTVNTLLLNGNPLLRYDGYYLLSDALEIPNLREQAAALSRRAFAALFGVASPQPAPPLQQHRLGWRAFMVAYFMASMIYRWVLAWGFVWLLQKLLAPYGLHSPALLLGAAFMFLFVGVPLLALNGWLLRPGNDALAANPRFWRRGAVMLALLAAAALIPIPAQVSAPGIVEAHHGAVVVTTRPGSVVEIVSPGTDMQPGQTVARLENREMSQAFAQLTGEWERRKSRAESLLRRQNDPLAAAELATAQAAAIEAEKRVREAETQLAELTLTSPRGGTLLPPRERRNPPRASNVAAPPRGESRADPTGWQGLPTAARNRGTWLESGTELGTIANPREGEVWALLAQHEVPLVVVGQQVRFRLDSRPGEELTGTVAEIAAGPLAAVEPELLARNPADFTAAHPSAPEQQRGVANAAPVVTSYFARIELTPGDRTLSFGATGTARIQVAPQSLVERGSRWFARTFGW